MASVCILTSAHSPFDTRIFHKQAQSLSKAGYDVKIIAHHDSSESRNGIRIDALAPVDNHQDRFTDLWTMYRRAVATNADIYHLHDPGLLPVGVALALRTDASVVFDIHEQYEKAFQYYDFPPEMVTPLFVKSYPRFQSLCCRLFDGVITTNKAETERFERAGHQNVVTVHNYPITDHIEVGEVDVDRTSDYVLGYVGSMGPVRGLEKMLACTRRLREDDYDVELWLIGELGEYEPMVTDYVTSHGIEDAVRPFGYVDYSRMFSYIQYTDVGLVFLDPERFQRDIPTKLFEYMFVELPVVATKTGSVIQLVDESFARLVDFDDTAEQANTIGDLLKNPEMRQSMGETGKELVERRYSWKHEEKKLLSFYETL
jgi:glycosyltransferase involved in cell wall biosynthesis